VAGDNAAAGRWGAGSLHQPSHRTSGDLATTGEQRSDANEAVMGYLPYGYFPGAYLRHWVDVVIKMLCSKLHQFETYIHNKSFQFQVFLWL